METIIKTKDITKSYFVEKEENVILKGINFEVQKGEFIAIVGESGSGKSTFLYIVAGIDKPTSGEVLLFDKNIHQLKDDEIAKLRREEISFVYQSDNLVDSLTVEENIVLPLTFSKVKKEDYKEKFNKLVQFFGIEKRLKNYPNQLSGGEQQRVAIARALMIDPKIIFLDEPTGALDKERGKQVMEYLDKIHKEYGVTMLMVTHSLAHANYADRIVTMEDGLLK